MARRGIDLPDTVYLALDLVSGRWEIVAGSKHYKIMVDRRLVAVWPRQRGAGDKAPRSTKNVIASIRRCANQSKE